MKRQLEVTIHVVRLERLTGAHSNNKTKSTTARKSRNSKINKFSLSDDECVAKVPKQPKEKLDKVAASPDRWICLS